MFVHITYAELSDEYLDDILKQASLEKSKRVFNSQVSIIPKIRDNAKTTVTTILKHIDLITGRKIGINRTDKYDFDAEFLYLDYKNDRVDSYMKDLMLNDQHKIYYLQMLLGCIFVSRNEKFNKPLWFYGGESSGKNTLSNIIENLIKDDNKPINHAFSKKRKRVEIIESFTNNTYIYQGRKKPDYIYVNFPANFVQKENLDPNNKTHILVDHLIEATLVKHNDEFLTWMIKGAINYNNSSITPEDIFKALE